MSESSLTVIAPKSVQETADLATRLAKSALLPEAYRGKEADVFMTLLAGSELGLLPVQSLNAFDVIKGKAAMKPVAMLALVRSNRDVEYARVEASATSATIATKLRGDDFVAKTTFTMQQAQAAGLAGNDNYRRFPQQMLTWRCIGLHCRTHHSDIIGGYYTTEEAETFEKDVTPAAARVDAQPAVEAAKEAVKAKRRMLIVDAPAASPPRAPVSTDEDEATVGWGGNAKSLLSVLTDDALRRYRDDAEKKAAANADDSRDLWAARYARYCSELDRRATSSVAVESAVTP